MRVNFEETQGLFSKSARAALVRLGSNRSDPLDLDLMAETGWGRLETRLLAQLRLGSARATAQADGGLASGSGDGAAWR